MSARLRKLFLFSAIVMPLMGTFGLPVQCSADIVNITDGTSTFLWNTDTGESSISSVHGNYSAAFAPMIRYQNLADGLQTRTAATFEGSGTQRAVVSNSVQNIGSLGLVTIDYGTINGNNPIINDLQLTIALVIDTNDFGGTLSYAMELENVGSTELTAVEMFQYYDWDVGGSSDNTGSRWTTSEFEGMIQQGAADQTVFHGTNSFENWEIGAYDSIESKLLANGDLTDSGTPFGPGDMTAAFGWNVGTMGVGQTKNVGLIMEGISAIPEPGHAMVLGLSFLACLIGRRRQLTENRLHN